MLLALTAAAAILSLAALAGLLVVEWRKSKPRTWLDELEAKAVVVHLRGPEGKSYAGTLVAVYRDAVVLRHASLLVENGDRLSLVGDVGIPRAMIDSFQYDADVVLAEPGERLPVRVQ